MKLEEEYKLDKQSFLYTYHKPMLFKDSYIKKEQIEEILFGPKFVQSAKLVTLYEIEIFPLKELIEMLIETPDDSFVCNTLVNLFTRNKISFSYASKNISMYCKDNGLDENHYLALLFKAREEKGSTITK